MTGIIFKLESEIEVEGMGQFKLELCDACAAALRVILRTRGAEAMAEAAGDLLCDGCKRKIPGYDPRRRLAINLKRVH